MRCFALLVHMPTILYIDLIRIPWFLQTITFHSNAHSIYKVQLHEQINPTQLFRDYSGGLPFKAEYMSTRIRNQILRHITVDTKCSLEICGHQFECRDTIDVFVR